MRKFIGFLCFAIMLLASTASVMAGPVEDVAIAASEFDQPISERGLGILVRAVDSNSRWHPSKDVSTDSGTYDELPILAEQFDLDMYSRLVVSGDVVIESGILLKVDQSGFIGKDRMRLNGDSIEDGFYAAIEETILVSSDGKKETVSPGELVEVIPLADGASSAVTSCSANCTGDNISSACCYKQGSDYRCKCLRRETIDSTDCIAGGHGSTGCSINMTNPIAPPAGSGPPGFEAPVPVDGEPTKVR